MYTDILKIKLHLSKIFPLDKESNSISDVQVRFKYNVVIVINDSV